MAQPSPYNRAYNFSNFQASHPAEPIPAAPLDEEFGRIKVVLDQVRAAIKQIQRDDTALANNSVGYDQLKAELDGFGFNPPAAWQSSKNYVVRDTIFALSGFYQCAVSHVSGADFNVDLAAGKWTLIADFSDIASVTDASFLVSGTLDDARLSFTVTPYAKTLLDDADATEARATLEVSSAAATSAADTVILNLAAPVGSVQDFAGTSAPTGWLLCYGQAVSRTTYSGLFDVIGTTYGAGDTTTTFNLPDCRGRVTAGKDNMGGSSANRLTGQTGGLNGDNLGATGGTETHVLTTAQMAAHTHAAGTLAADSAGAHTHTIAMTTSGDDNPGGGNNPISTSGGGAVPVNPATHISANSNGAHGHTISGSTASVGSDTAHNNVQPTIVFNKIIKH